MEFRLLGPVEAITGGRQIDLGHRRQRLILAVLALEANRPVPIDRLIGLSWPTAPPRTATHAIRVSVSQLRTVLTRVDPGNEVVSLVGKGSSYLLRTEVTAVDAHRFRAMVQDARGAADDEGKVAVLRQALQLWRGPVLTGVAPDETRDALGRGLEEARLVALEDRIDAELRLARHRELLDELTGLVEAHPLRERLTGQLMLALYWSGQAGAALEAFRRTRQRLADELGIDPGAELRRLEIALLRNDAALAAPAGLCAVSLPSQLPAPMAVSPAPFVHPARPAQLPAAVADFTGRVAELRRLAELGQEGDQAPAAPIVTVTGPAGVGKTALALHWAQLSRARFIDGQLFADLRGYAQQPALSPAAVLGRFLRALGLTAGQVPGDLDEAAALYRTLLAGRQILIVLDNAATAQQVRPLLPGAPGCLVIITSRDQLGGLTARDGARRLGLGPLSRDEARLLLTRLIGSYWTGAEPAAADSLAQSCEYLPLALRIAAAHVSSRPVASISGCAAELSEGSILTALHFGGDEQATLRAVLGPSYARLGPDARRLFRLIGVAPCRDLTAGSAAALAGGSPAQAQRLLDQLASGHLLSECAPGRFAASDLLRSYARELAEAEDSEQERTCAVLRLLELCSSTVAAAWRAISARPERLSAVSASGPVPVRFADAGEAAAWLDAESANIAAASAYAAAHGMRPLARQFARLRRGLPAGAGQLGLPSASPERPMAVAGLQN